MPDFAANACVRVSTDAAFYSEHVRAGFERAGFVGVVVGEPDQFTGAYFVSAEGSTLTERAVDWFSADVLTLAE